jgi:hypothetical protein
VGMDESGAVTLIFYAVDTKNLFSEPFLNICAAIGQMSKLTHVEIAIGTSCGASGEMQNVARVFNDSIGCELTERTGRNPKCVPSCKVEPKRNVVYKLDLRIPLGQQVHVFANWMF